MARLQPYWVGMTRDISPPRFNIHANVTASTRVSACVLNLLRRGWILAEGAESGKRKLYDPLRGSHRRFTSFPQDLQAFAGTGLTPLVRPRTVDFLRWRWHLRFYETWN